MRNLISIVLASVFLVPGELGASDISIGVEETIAWEMLTLEAEGGTVPDEASELLRAALETSTREALAVTRFPASASEALAAMRAITVELAKLNFIQPAREIDWPQTIGEALQPRRLSEKEFALNMLANRSREQYIDSEQPIYFLDCDMGSLIFLSIGQRLGWDIRLVEVPKHNFVRWHLNPWERINWDWTHDASLREAQYAHHFGGSPDPRWEQHYLRSLALHEARAYYIALLASETSELSRAERLFREALAAQSGHPLTLNNYAWLYATTPGLPSEKYDLAVALSLSAWSQRTTSANFADTVACSFAARGEIELGLAIEKWAIQRESDPGKLEGFKKNAEKISGGVFCE